MKTKSYLYSIAFLIFLIPCINLIFEEPRSNCIIDLGSDVEILLGDSVEIYFASSCPLPVESIVWSPTTDLSCSDCLTPTSYALNDVCYTLTVTWPDGEVASDELCVFVRDCEHQITENKVIAVTPEQVSNEAEVSLEIAVAQNVKVETVNDQGEIEYSVWEGWVRAGTPTLTIDFSALPSGEHNLRFRMYPENKFLKINKI